MKDRTTTPDASQMAPSRWRDEAACLSEDPELWFPETPQEADLARRICLLECPVRRQCLEDALKAEEGRGLAYRSGIRAGMDEAERLALDSTPRIGRGQRKLKAEASA